MPEGFSSISDLRIVVDASTEKLAGSLDLAKNIVTRFSEESAEKLSLFERAAGGLGNGAAALSARANVWAAALATVSSYMSEINEKGAKVAALGGKQDEWQQLVSAYEEMLAAIQEGAPRALGRAGQALADYAASGKSVQMANEGVAASGYEVNAAQEKTAETATLSASQIADGMAQLSRMSRQMSNDVVAANEVATNSFGELKKQTPFESLMSTMKDTTHFFRSMSDESTWSAATISKEMDVIASHIETLNKRLKTVQSGGFDVLKIFGTDEAMQKLQDGIAVSYAREQALNGMMVDRQRGNYNTAFDSAVSGIDQEIVALEEKAETLGMTKGEAAEYAATMKIVNDMEARGLVLTEASKASLDEKGSALRKLVDAQQDEAKAKAAGDAADRLLKSLDSEIRNLEQQSGMLGKSTTEIAANNAEMRFRNQLADQGIKLSTEQSARADAAIRKIRAETEANAERRQALNEENTQTRTFDQAILSLQRQTIALRGKTDALFDNSEAGRINALVEQQLNELKARGVPITDARIAGLRREAAAQIDAALAQEQAQRQLDVLKNYASTVTSGLEGAFRKWADGSKLSVKDMVSSMLSDLAMLTFKRGVTDNLMSLAFGGGGSGGGGLLSGLFGGGGGGAGLGSWAPTISGYRADGGDVDAGRAYMVGERGQETFIPRVPGTIIPNGGLGNAINVTLSTTIDARGATEGTATLIQRALSERDAQLPSQIMTVVQSGRDRGLV